MQHFITLSETDGLILANPQITKHLERTSHFELKQDLLNYPNVYKHLNYTQDDAQNYGAYHFYIEDQDLNSFALNIIAYISDHLSSFSDDGYYCDELPSIIQELYLILKQEILTDHPYYKLLTSFYQSLIHIYDENETYNPIYKFTTAYIPLNQ